MQGGGGRQLGSEQQRDEGPTQVHHRYSLLPPIWLRCRLVMTAPSDDDRFNLEVVKLLLEIAWADQEVDEREKQMILGAARSWSVPEPELKVLMTRLEQGTPLPKPDLELLRTRADDVMTAARALVLSDGKVKKEESALLKQLAAQLA